MSERESLFAETVRDVLVCHKCGRMCWRVLTGGSVCGG